MLQAALMSTLYFPQHWSATFPPRRSWRDSTPSWRGGSRGAAPRQANDCGRGRAYPRRRPPSPGTHSTPPCDPAADKGSLRCPVQTGGSHDCWCRPGGHTAAVVSCRGPAIRHQSDGCLDVSTSRFVKKKNGTARPQLVPDSVHDPIWLKHAYKRCPRLQRAGQAANVQPDQEEPRTMMTLAPRTRTRSLSASGSAKKFFDSWN
jgi:hypothetical protein